MTTDRLLRMQVQRVQCYGGGKLRTQKIGLPLIHAVALELRMGLGLHVELGLADSCLNPSHALLTIRDRCMRGGLNR
jgi:hypothetical protein